MRSMAGKITPLEEVERRRAALRAADGNVSIAAKNLGMLRQTLSNWLNRHPLPDVEKAAKLVPVDKTQPTNTRRAKRKEETTVELSPVDIFRRFFESYDSLKRQLGIETEKVVQLEATVKGLKDENIRLRGQLSFYEDQEKRRTEEWRKELHERVSEMGAPGD